jgi:hypothetical protein
MEKEVVLSTTNQQTPAQAPALPMKSTKLPVDRWSPPMLSALDHPKSKQLRKATQAS